jgi:hypothetical protein
VMTGATDSPGDADATGPVTITDRNAEFGSCPTTEAQAR